MTTKLDKPIRREIDIEGEPFTVVITPQGVRLTRKRFRSGKVVSWKTILDGHRGGAPDHHLRPLDD